MLLGCSQSEDELEVAVIWSGAMFQVDEWLDEGRT